MTTQASNRKPAAANKMSPRLVADDNGYAAHKLAWIDQAGKIMTGKVATMIQAGGNGLSTTKGNRVGAYGVNGNEYHCSPIISSPLNIRNQDYPVSVANRVLFNHALAKFGLLGVPVRAAVTLPFRDYFNADGTMNEKLKDAVETNFSTRDVTVFNSESQPDVISVRVCAEALSAWFDWAMDDLGNMTADYNELHDLNGQMLVVDIGGSTTDLVALGLVDGELLINHQKSGTEKVGVLDALSKLDDLVRATMNAEGAAGMSSHDSKMPQNLLEMILEKGKCSYAGKGWNFEGERDAACRGVAESIVSYIKSKVGNPGQYNYILVVGGGAIVFKKWITEIFTNATFGDEFSNARGALKYMRGAM
ncbi:ParM/StbA family protein [Pseudomonas sp. o96-267]|uniref:ParM/StbA family protein n=1 Tax=Pseudomonas sp. o96-267 TaxID=2479853 RepID=UPI000F7758FC|nr:MULTISPECIES: ParM/StbA family protein [Pseudomonas]MDH0959062.1 ParM/StbA family protein [Pseudomonas chengduensis]MDV5863631.1 ParM/StbA family protein [Pseudomonas mendocina]RRV31745.1 ParM/StbA family protein [Pseudomonas sp. o96-267]